MKKLQVSGVLLAGAASILFAAQAVWAQAAKVTGVRLNPTNRGFNLVLETSGERSQVFTSRQGNTLVTDIVNAQLSLPQGKNFRQNNPAPGIASVVISQLEPNSVRMVITGNTSAPNSQIAERNAQGITLSISPGTGTTAATPTLPRRNTPAATPPTTAQRQRRQTPTAQKPNVLVPNPKVTIDGKPAPAAGTPQPATPPPTLPRAIAPPVGDIAISNADASPDSIDLGSNERVPRLVLRDAPAREVLSLLARAANLNLAFTTAQPPGGQQNQPTPSPDQQGNEGPRVSLDIQDESVQDVFNYVLRITGLQANRSGRTIFVGPRLPNQARDVIVRSYRLNQVRVADALNFLTAMGAESAVSRERTVTSVNAVPVGGAATPATQTQTSTETRIETNRIDIQDAVPILRGLQIVGDERTNAVTLIGSPKQVDIAAAQLVQLDSRRRQVSVNVKIVDVNLLASQDNNTSFSFGIGDSFFSTDGGAATLNFGGVNPPTSGEARTSRFSPPITTPGFPEGTDQGPFLDPQPNAPFGNTPSGVRAPFGTNSNPLAPGVIRQDDAETTFQLPTLFQFPTRFLARLQTQVTSGNAKILTDPTLTVQEGQTAQVNLTEEVFAGTEIQYVTANAGGNAIPVERPVTKEAGLTLLLRIERIDDNGFVSLSVAPTVSAPNGGSATTSTGEVITLLTERSLTSGLIRLRDGQTLILSGIIQDQDTTDITKVPILGDLPIIGSLFRRTAKNNTRNEVIVLLTPQILDDSQDSSPMGYNYQPSPEARQLLERRGVQVPGNNPQPRNR